MQTDRPSSAWLWAPLLLGLATPSLVIFIMDVSFARQPMLAAMRNIASRQFADGDNLFLLAAIGLIPFALLTGILFLVRRSSQPQRVSWLSAGGTVGALAFMIPAHVSVWLPVYTKDQMSSTAVIAFIFIPLVCCVTMAFGLLVATFASRRIRAQTA